MNIPPVGARAIPHDAPTVPTPGIVREVVYTGKSSHGNPFASHQQAPKQKLYDHAKGHDTQCDGVDDFHKKYKLI